MKKYIFILGVIVLWMSVNGQGHNRNIKLVAFKRGCVMKLIFKNSNKGVLYIPDFSLRSDTMEGYKVLRREAIKAKHDTLIISVYSIKNKDEVNEVVVNHSSQNKRKVIVRHNDIKLQKRSMQSLRLPTDFCTDIYKVLLVLYDDKLLAQCVFD